MSEHTNHTPPILLTIAGFDPSCGAGVAADLKTFAAHNCYGVAAVTAVESAEGPKQEHEVVFLQNFFDELRRRVPLGK